MGLSSKHFSGNAALEACLVKDSTHILQGARGRHVGKIQEALAILDGALIASAEAIDETYGVTTAAAVLAYKKARNIINRSYQQQADNIVGKMTIDSLDKGMLSAERSRKHFPCHQPVIGGAARTQVQALNGGLQRDGQQQLPAKTLAILIQLVRVKGKLGRHAFELAIELVPRANELLKQFGMKVGRLAGFSLEFPRKVKYGETEEFLGLRKAAENAMPGFKPALRVLICPFRTNQDGDDDVKTNGASFSLKGFDRFVVLNANTLRADRGTLLHEMIHCSDESLMSDLTPPHDPIDSDSVFSWNPNRTRLKVEHARSLQKAFFAG